MLIINDGFVVLLFRYFKQRSVFYYCIYQSHINLIMSQNSHLFFFLLLYFLLYYLSISNTITFTLNFKKKKEKKKKKKVSILFPSIFTCMILALLSCCRFIFACFRRSSQLVCSRLNSVLIAGVWGSRVRRISPLSVSSLSLASYCCISFSSCCWLTKGKMSGLSFSMDSK